MSRERYAVSSSAGIDVYSGFEEPNLIFQIKYEKLKYGCLMTASPDGSLFAYCDAVNCVVFDTEKWQKLCAFPALNCEHISILPKRRLVCTWRQNVVFGMMKTAPQPNLCIFSIDTGDKVAEFTCAHKNYWAWSDDETVFVLMTTSELHYYDGNQLDRFNQKLVVKTMSDFSLSPGPPPFHVMCYIPANSTRPASARMFACSLIGSIDNVVANRSFFQADRAKMVWNQKGTAVLVMAVADVDAQGASYYGKESLFLLRTTGESCMVSLNKDGPIHAIDWHPNSQIYCVVYGFMPPKAALFNLDADILYDFGTGPKNLAYFNPFGNVICLCGFGNIRGNVEVWAPRDKKVICKFIAEDTTLFRWFDDGKHFVTATTTPRLRVNNRYKIWDISGRTIQEHKYTSSEELYDFQFLPTPKEKFSPPVIPEACTDAVLSQAASPAAVPGTKNGVYIAPGLRGRPRKVLEPVELKVDAGGDRELSKQARRNRKKKEAKKKIQSVSQGATETN